MPNCNYSNVSVVTHIILNREKKIDISMCNQSSVLRIDSTGSGVVLIFHYISGTKRNRISFHILYLMILGNKGFHAN